MSSWFKRLIVHKERTAYLSVTQFVNALDMILAASSMHSTGWLLCFEYRSAYGISARHKAVKLTSSLTSAAMSRKSRRMANSAGNVHPLCSVKNRRKNLCIIININEMSSVETNAIAHRTNSRCSLNASFIRFRATFETTSAYCIQISSRGGCTDFSYVLRLRR